MKLFTILVTTFIVMINFSCGEPEEPMEPGPYVVPESFELAGKWEFVTVSGEGTIGGLPQSDTDESPEGFVEFYDFGQGISDVSLTLLGRELVKEQENINWEWVNNNTIDIEEEDGAHEIWTILSTTDSTMTASWFIEILTNEATITADLRRIE